MFGASTVVPGRKVPIHDERDARADRALAKARDALEKRARLDAEVDRVEQYLRDRQ